MLKKFLFFTLLLYIQLIVSSYLFSSSIDKNCMTSKLLPFDTIRTSHLEFLMNKIDELGEWRSYGIVLKDEKQMRTRQMKSLLTQIPSTQFENVKAFDYFIEKMKTWTKNNWQAEKLKLKDGSIVYTGGDRALIFKKDGKIYTANIYDINIFKPEESIKFENIREAY